MSVLNTTFTATEIARALGCSRQNIHSQLTGIAADGEKLAAGNLAKAWALNSLPASLVRQLTIKAEAKGYRTTASLLMKPFTRFEARLPLSEMAPPVIDRARKLQSALQCVIPLRNDRSITPSDFTARGLAFYKLEFGYAVGKKHWRALLDRTVERDNGAEEWNRLELYIDEKPARISGKLPISLAREKSLEVLEDAMVSLQGNATLSIQQSLYLWTKSCDQLQLEIENGARPKRVKRAKRSILQVLLKSGFVGKDFHSIRRNFDRKWKVYLANSGLRQDGRSLRYAKADPVVEDEDFRKLIWSGLNRGGRVSQAFRESFQNDELSSKLTERFIVNPARKSYVPQSVRRAIASEIKRLMPYHRDPREHELRGPHNHRVFLGIMSAGDSFQADDCTCPVIYFEPDSASRSGYRFLRGQLVLMIDERSLLALGFALHSENNYNARIIRALITRVHDSYGLPRRHFYFERGIWKTAKILTGGRQPIASELEMAHTELGLREFGVKFLHAKLPRGKVIERVLGLIQNQMERLPGYVGRNERSDRFARVQEQLNDARSGKINPAKYFLSKDQWIEALTNLLDHYNAERQEGKLLNGLSPREAWNRFQSTEGLVQLGDKARYLLAHHKLKLRVRRDGITLRPSLGGGNYCNETTGRFAGQDVLVWCNPEELDYVAVTSLDRKEGPFVVPRLEPIPAIDASAEQLRRNSQQIDSHNDYAKTAYRLISPHLVAHNFRRLFTDSKTVEMGDRFESGIEQVKAHQHRKSRNASKVQKLSRQLNMRPVGPVSSDAIGDIAEGFDLIAESRELRAAQNDNGSSTNTAAKVFVLDAPTKLTTKQRNAMYWRLLKAAEAAEPGLNAFAIMTNALGSVKKITEMTDQEFRKVCHLLVSIAEKDQVK